MTDFSQAKFTAVISDLHLCEAEPVRSSVPLWKKYKTRQFFYDDVFGQFLGHLDAMSGGEPVELVLNGDIFDFDSVMTLPEDPPYHVSRLEEMRGLHTEEEKSLFKITKVLEDHSVWIEALRDFVRLGHRVVFIMGNHDLELHWPRVQQAIVGAMFLTPTERERIRFCEWFYISNSDTLIEHGNQYDPYCLCADPVHPFIRKYNKVGIRLPFGNIACRYMINGMGFFNPHVDSNYIMTLKEYLRFFIRYIVRAQPLLIWTWFWGAVMTLIHSFGDTLKPSLKDPLRIEDRIDKIAAKANATPRMVRELKELFAHPATMRPWIVARELWLDRAFILMLGMLSLFQTFLFIKQVYDITVFWMFIPILLLVPFFMFYSRFIDSNVHTFKEPQEDLLSMAAAITHTQRIIYGHTHIVRHEIIGAVEHLNPGAWSPAFLDVECTKPIGQKSFVWLQPGSDGIREAKLLEFRGGESVDAFNRKKQRQVAQ